MYVHIVLCMKNIGYINYIFHLVKGKTTTRALLYNAYMMHNKLYHKYDSIDTINPFFFVF